jgi:RND superfamily putative drug exporter
MLEAICCRDCASLIPRAEAGTDLRVYVGGTTATNIDFASALTSKLPLFLAIIAVLGFLLLTLAFRSLLVPAIGAIGNLLTIAVALGSTVALFQWGWGQPLFGVGGPAPLEYTVAILIVGVVFGLSMDYHVFLVSRMHESWTRNGDNRRAVTNSPATAKTHVNRTIMKLHARDRAQLVVIAYETGLITLGRDPN